MEKKRTVVEVPVGSVEKAVLEAYRVGKAGGRVVKVRLEARAVSFVWEEHQGTTTWLGRKIGAALRRLAAILDRPVDNGGQDAEEN